MRSNAPLPSLCVELDPSSVQCHLLSRPHLRSLNHSSEVEWLLTLLQNNSDSGQEGDGPSHLVPALPPHQVQEGDPANSPERLLAHAKSVHINSLDDAHLQDQHVHGVVHHLNYSGRLGDGSTLSHKEPQEELCRRLSNPLGGQPHVVAPLCLQLHLVTSPRQRPPCDGGVKEPVHQDVRISTDGRRKVGVEWHVEGEVVELSRVEHASAKVPCKLHWLA